MAGSDDDAVDSLVRTVDEAGRRADALALIGLMSDVTGEDPKVWSSNTIGFGTYHYRYESGQEGDFFPIGFAPRNDRTTIYVMSGLRGFEDILDRLGPHTSGKSTIHVKRLADVDRSALAELIAACVEHVAHVEETLGAIPRMSQIPPRQA